MSRAIAAVLLLATIAAPLSGQVCTYPVTLRTEACPPGSGTGCTLKGSPLTWQEVDRTFLDVLGICRTVGAYTWEAPAPGYLRSDLLGSVSPASASGVGLCPAGELVGGLLDNAAPECRPDDDAPEAGDFGALALTGDVESVGLVTTITPGAVSHGGLGGLSGDDHPQYPLMAGRALGQTLAGGVASGEHLTLQSTTHATPGQVQIGGSVYDTGAFWVGLYVDPTAASGAGLQIRQAGGSGYTDLIARGLLTRSGANFGVWLSDSGNATLHVSGRVGWSTDPSATTGVVDTTLRRAAAGLVRIGDALRLTPRATPPVVCSVGDEGSLYTDDSHALCYCNGSAWTNLTPADGGACS